MICSSLISCTFDVLLLFLGFGFISSYMSYLVLCRLNSAIVERYSYF
jgi:hypothetical protein